MAKKNGAAPRSYKELYKALPKMSEAELRAAMQEELDKPNPRPDMLARMVGRFNRLRGNRTMTGVLGLLSYKGKRNLDAVLDNDG